MAAITMTGVIEGLSIVSSAISIAMTISQIGKSAPTGKDSGAEVRRKGADNPKICAFGECRIPCVEVWRNVNNSDSEYLAEVFSCGYGPLKEINEIYLDAVGYFGENDNSDHSERWYDGANEFPNVEIGIRRGNPTSSTWDQIVNNSDMEWTYEHRGDRTGSISFLIKRKINESGDNNVRITNPNFKVEALVKGNKVIDPRLDPNLEGIHDLSKRTWTEGSYRNPANVLITYCLDPHFGMALDPSAIDLTSFILLANYCELNNLFFDGYVSADDTFGQVLTSMASSFNGLIYIEGGLLKVRPLTTQVPKYHFTENDLINEEAITVSNNNESEYANALIAEFINKESEYNQDKFCLPTDQYLDEQIQKDGMVKEYSLKLPYTTDPATVQRFSNEVLKQKKYCNKSMTITINNVDYNVQIGDVITMSHNLYQMDKQKFRVTGVKSTLDDKTMQSRISCEEYRDEVYDTQYQDGIISGAVPPLNIQVLPVTNLSFEQNNSLTIGSGTLRWEPQHKGECRYRVDYKISTSQDWIHYNEISTEYCIFTNLQSGIDYDFRVLVVTPYKTSTWAYLNGIRINRNITLPAVQNLTGDFSGIDAIFKWDAISGTIPPSNEVADGISNYSQLLSHYEIEIKHGSVTKSTYRSATPTFTYTFSENAKNTLSRDLTAIVRGFSLYGDISTSMSCTVRNKPMDQPSGVQVKAELSSLSVKFDNVNHFSDYSHSKIYICPDQQTPASETYFVGSCSTGFWTAVSDHETGWVRVEHLDHFGSANPIVTSAPIYFITQNIDDLLGESPSFQEIDENLEQAMKDLEEHGGEITELTDQVTLNTSSINENKILISTAQQDLVQLENSLETTNGQVLEQSQLIETVDGKVSAMHQITLTANGKVSGVQMSNDGEYSEFAVLADCFSVSDGVNDQNVFEVRNGSTYIKNALIGDLNAEQIQAGSITGNEISSNTLIRAGSGVTSASLDGTSSEWRIYAGSIDGNTAPFRVSTTGQLFSTDAHISGTVNASSGSITGRLEVYQGYIDGRENFDSINLGNGNFRVDTNGNLFANGGEFNGTIKAEKIEGNVVQVRALEYVPNQTITFPATNKSRTVVVNGVSIEAAGGRSDDGGSSPTNSSSEVTATFTINGNVHSIRLSARGDEIKSKTTGHTVVVPANTPITINIQFEGEAEQGAGWSYDVHGAVAMAI